MAHKNPIRSFFASVKLAVVLLIAIAAASILGTLIPQQEAAGPFIARLGPGWSSFLMKIQVFDVFHSFWYAALMALLALNLIVCSLDLLPRTWRRYRRKDDPDRMERLADLPAARIVVTGRDREEAAKRATSLLEKIAGPVTRRERGERIFLHAHRGAYSHFGVPIIHAGVLIVMAGVMIGLFSGFEGYMTIPEGESTATVRLKSGRGERVLPFSVRCDRFVLEFYENGAPRTYRSDLTFLQNGREAQSAAVLVNHPVTFGGIRFYQSSYGTMPGGNPVLTVVQRERKVMEVEIAPEMAFVLPEHRATVRVLRVEDNLMDMGPAVKLGVTAPSGSRQFWVFAAIEQIVAANPGILEQVPLFDPASFAPYLFSLRAAERRPYTGLQAARDPGVPMVALGAAVLMAGLLVVYFRSHRRFWILLETADEGTRIGVVGRSSRDEAGMNRELDRLADAIGAEEEAGT
ncbi:MAG: cytochrome c biogenesis protein ResB [Pseudomonadota bacterium]|nr:cytochrome c biogenesis protein ResB [Pseudomonadota bacterium]